MADAELTMLLAEVRKLEGTNSANTRAVRELAQIITDPETGLVKRLDVVARRNTTNRVIIFLLVLALLFGGFGIWEFKKYQDCRARYTDRFLALEKAKVSGQIVGVDGWLKGLDEIFARDPETGLLTYRVGTREFKSASQHYLDNIAHINTC